MNESNAHAITFRMTPPVRARGRVEFGRPRWMVGRGPGGARPVRAPSIAERSMAPNHTRTHCRLRITQQPFSAVSRWGYAAAVVPVDRTRRRSALEAPSVLDHDRGVAQHVDMPQRVAPNGNDVRELAFGNRA